MIELARRLIMGGTLACMAGATLPGCTSHHKPPVVVPTPPPPVVDPNAVPPKGQPVALNLLLRPAPGGRFQMDGKPFNWFQAIQCCGGAGAVLGDTVNTRWPLASEEWMDYSAKMGANAFHFRLGPFYGNDAYESEWSDIGGPMLTPGGPWNGKFWDKARALAWHAAKLNAIVEVVVIDTWYCKHAASSWGDQQMPWPQSDIDACGVSMTPVQEAFIRKAVDEFGGFGNVIWSVDNEGNLVRGWKREWFEAVHAIIRDEEKKAGNVVHMIGTNNPDIADGPWDYVATHARAPLTEPIAGKPTINNERNPSLGPEQEAAYFAQAREQGLGWTLWLADLTGDKVKRIFELFRDVAKGASAGCFPAPEDDPRWAGVPTRALPDPIGAALEQAKREVGDPTPAWRTCVAGGETPIACMFPTLEALSASMRNQGLCAGRSRDAIFAKQDDASPYWFELHAVAATNGGYSGTAYKGSTWRLNP